jgi:glycine oxidase
MKQRSSRRTFLQAAIGAGLAAPAWAAQGAKTFDVIVVGAGAIGCTTAYYLREEGLSVCLLDKGPAGREASWASAGMIQPYGSSKSEAWPTRAALLSRKLYDELEPKLFEETGRRIGYGGEGGLVIGFEDGDAAHLEAIVKAQAGDDFPAQFLSRDDARKREPGLPDQVAAAALLPGHRFLDARTFTAVIAEAARKKGVVVRENSPVTALVRSGKKVVGVASTGEQIAGGIVINACGAWAGKVDGEVPMRIAPVHGQILAIEGPKGGLRHNIQKLGAGGYMTPRADGRVLAGATSEDFGYEKKVTPNGLRSLVMLVRDVMPHLADHRVLDSWSGLRPGTPDGLPAVGHDARAENYFWAAGHGGYGMMQNPATAKVVTDLVMKRPPRLPIDSVDPARLVD